MVEGTCPAHTWYEVQEKVLDELWLGLSIDFSIVCPMFAAFESSKFPLSTPNWNVPVCVLCYFVGNQEQKPWCCSCWNWRMGMSPIPGKFRRATSFLLSQCKILLFRGSEFNTTKSTSFLWIIFIIFTILIVCICNLFPQRTLIRLLDQYGDFDQKSR